MRRVFVNTVFCTFTVILLLAGCGGSGDLGSVGEHPITETEYLEVFNNLPAEEQVAVLEPGGRMALMERIVRKRLLLAAWEEDQSVSSGWEELYRVSILSDSMYTLIASGFDYQSYIDSLAECGYSGFQLRAVLLDDSLSAAQVADSWNNGDYQSSVSSVTAPWSDPTGSSYRSFGGPPQRLTVNFFPLLDMELGVAHVLPMHGEWCVGLLELHEGEWIDDETAALSGLLNHVALTADEKVFAEGISSLAENCTSAGSSIMITGSGSDVPLFTHGSDTVTVAEAIDMMNRVSPENFFGEVPEELAFFSAPQLTISLETSLWFYVKSLAQHYALASLARQSGIQVSQGALDYARAESVVRDRLLASFNPDSSVVAQWFSDNADQFQLPERRSVLLAYTDSVSAVSVTDAAGFDYISNYQTIRNEAGEMVPTPLQAEQTFGPVLGEAVFAAEPGEFTGPVILDGELAAWFEVVEVAPPATADLHEVYPVVAAGVAGEMFAGGFEELILELRSSYPVEIDTTAVVEIDLWGGMQ